MDASTKELQGTENIYSQFHEHNRFTFVLEVIIKSLSHYMYIHSIANPVPFVIQITHTPILKEGLQCKRKSRWNDKMKLCSNIFRCYIRNFQTKFLQFKDFSIIIPNVMTKIRFSNTPYKTIKYYSHPLKYNVTLRRYMGI